jgi:hypothetical protein
MDEIEKLRRYGARSVPARPLKIDVTADVMATLRSRASETSASTTRTVFIAAAACWLLAAGIGFLAQQSLADAQDPLASLTAPFSVTLE